jgi:hypothetical protein
MRWPMLCALSILLAAALGVAQSQPNDSKGQTPAAANPQNPAEPRAATKASDPAAADAAGDHSPPAQSSKRRLHLRLGGVALGAGYSRFSGPIYPYPYSYPFAPYGFYPGDFVSASLWYPLWGPYPFYGPGHFSYNNGRGEVRLTADPKDARVYIDGGYAGTADKLRSLWLDPGAYDLTLSAPGREDFRQRLYVLSGKSLKITAKLSVSGAKEKP